MGVDNVRLVELKITSGKPQGALLGHLLFCVFINDLSDMLRFLNRLILRIV